MKPRYAILNEDRSLTYTDDHMLWAKNFDNPNRSLKQDTINGMRVSTVFLGLNHEYGEGRPKWFETMIFGGSEEYCERCETWQEALKMHEVAVEWAKDQKK